MDCFTTSDGSQIKYRIEGKGKPILFIHGWSVEYRLWFNRIESIKGNWKNTYRRIYFDLPGMGQSTAAFLDLLERIETFK